jgi:hypothetical protein
MAAANTLRLQPDSTIGIEGNSGRDARKVADIQGGFQAEQLDSWTRLLLSHRRREAVTVAG